MSDNNMPPSRNDGRSIAAVQKNLLDEEYRRNQEDKKAEAANTEPLTEQTEAGEQVKMFATPPTFSKGNKPNRRRRRQE